MCLIHFWKLKTAATDDGRTDHSEDVLQYIEVVWKVGGGRQLGDVEEVTQLLHDISCQVHVVRPYAQLQRQIQAIITDLG